MNKQEKFERLDINTVTLAEFLSAGIPQITKKRAESIIRERDVNGAFTSMDDLSRVAGIGPTFLNQLKLYCTV